MAASASTVRAARSWLYAGRLVLTTGTAPALYTLSLAGWCAVAWWGAIGRESHAHASSASPLSPASWLAMLVAMMTPLLVDPIDHLWTRSFRSVRGRRVALFALAYALAWTTAGWLLASASSYLTSMAPGASPAVAAVALALAWQTTPAKQICLNRCHALPTIRAFGPGDREVLYFGLRFGWWCFGSCWALMLVSMCVGGPHVLVMAATTAVAVGERHAACRPPEWRLPLSRRSR